LSNLQKLYRSSLFLARGRSKMYRVFPSSDDLNLDDRPNWLHWVEQCASTNTWAIAHAADLGHGDVVFTRHQTAGKGQQGRIWHSPPGVLTASFVLDRLPTAQLPGLSLAAGLAVIYAIEDLLAIDPPTEQSRQPFEREDLLRLKWSNDVLLDRRKVAGILCEATSSLSAGTARVVVGIGLNRCVDFAEAGLTADAIGEAASLHQVFPTVPDEFALLERLRYYLLQVANLFSRAAPERPGLALLLPELRRRDALIDRFIRIELPGESVSGQAAGIDDSGRLLLRLPDQQIRTFTSGHVLWN
jgi:BirA family transcriptional regulator, biotin operon repressor / biotin---[acetyl-CoA-carboxylase] ligase